MPSLSAMIIKGNPKFIRHNAQATKFYQSIRAFLERLGYRVRFNAGAPYTSPPPADLWIGHSRGVDRLRFASKKTKTLAFGSSVAGAVNHSRDASQHIYGPTDIVPNRYHYVFTRDMRAAIIRVTKQMRLT